MLWCWSCRRRFSHVVVGTTKMWWWWRSYIWMFQCDVRFHRRRRRCNDSILEKSLKFEECWRFKWFQREIIMRYVEDFSVDCGELMKNMNWDWRWLKEIKIRDENSSVEERVSEVSVEIIFCYPSRSKNVVPLCSNPVILLLLLLLLFSCVCIIRLLLICDTDAKLYVLM